MSLEGTPPMPILYENYKILVFTDDDKYCKKILLKLCLPLSFIIDIFMFIPKNIKSSLDKNKISTKNI